MTYDIKLPQFEGPFDLLLFFIERDELEIQDIPIASITQDFLDYIKLLERLNIEIASEFILVASTLMVIKAKMLLPRKEIDEQGNEIDPRQDLVERLLEYKKYKTVTETLTKMEDNFLSKEKRGNLNDELRRIQSSNSIFEELQSLDLYGLMLTFEKVVKRFEDQQNQPKHVVVQYPFTIEEKKSVILSQLSIKSTVDFEELIVNCSSRIELIYIFLAVLELIQSNAVSIVIGEGYNNFWLNAAGH